jgi:hypothetical protein
MFDKKFSKIDKNGEAVYDIPFPIGELMKKISNRNRSDILHTMLPFSRSLQRPKGNRYDPLLNPRLVFSAKQSESTIERAKIFLGYVKQTDQLEVISYNDQAGRFEYQLVKNYSNNPKVFYVNRGKCLSCHQGQAPIFSVPGWQDTNSGVLGNLIGAKLGVENAASLNGKKVVASKLFGRMPSTDAVGNFDALVREANEISLNERVWTIGCGDNNQCRLGLLLQTLAPSSIQATKYFKLAEQTIQNSELAKQSMYSSFLLSTDLGAKKVIRKYSNTGPGTAYENTANSEEAILEIIGNIYKLSESENPGTKRKMSFTREGLFPRKLQTFTNKDITLIQKEIPNVSELLVRMYQDGHSMFKQSAINKPFVMKSLLQEVSSPKAGVYKNYLAKKTPKKVLFSGSVIPVFKKMELNVFARYCQQCHATGMPFPPQFLVGSEKEVVNKIEKLKDKIHFKLKYNLMPPNKKERELMKKSGDYLTLLEYIQSFRPGQ